MRKQVYGTTTFYLANQRSIDVYLQEGKIEPRSEVDLVRAFIAEYFEAHPRCFDQRCANKSNFGEARFSQANSLISKEKVFVKTPTSGSGFNVEHSQCTKAVGRLHKSPHSEGTTASGGLLSY